MRPAYRLVAGASGPTQQSSVSCGAAALVVARMLRDAVFAGSIVEGEPGDRRTPTERFADAERATMRRTNALLSPAGRLQAPWPPALGTPPWGALAELTARGSEPGVTYGIVPLRLADEKALNRTYDEALAPVRPGAPVLLYVGDARLPRHVCLVFSDAGRREALVYEPSSGAVSPLERMPFVSARLDLGGWRRPWLLVAPQAATDRPGLLARLALRAPARTAGVLLRHRP